MITKPFSKELHDKYDVFGRDIVKKFVSKYGWVAKDHPDPLAVDLILYKDDKKIGYAEVEVRAAWKTIYFPFSDLNVPARKAKFFRSTDLPALYFAINLEGTALFYCNGKTILKKSSMELDNKFMQNEGFYKVDLGDLKYHELY